MKTIIRTALVLILSITLFNCNNDDDTTARTVYAEENPLNAFINQSGYNEITISKYNSLWVRELGFSFTPKVKGEINAITVKIPNTNPALRVTIWDFDNQTVLRTETINVATADSDNTFPITPLALTKDKRYLISMNTVDWYERRRTDFSAAPYPFLIGNIEINSSHDILSTTQSFPNNFANISYFGNCSFVFQQTP